MSTNERKYYKTTITFTALSDEPIPEEMTIAEIDDECDTGSFVGGEETREEHVLTGDEMADALYSVGSTPEFFDLGAPRNDDDSEDEVNEDDPEENPA